MSLSFTEVFLRFHSNPLEIYNPIEVILDGIDVTLILDLSQNAKWNSHLKNDPAVSYKS